MWFNFFKQFKQPDASEIRMGVSYEGYDYPQCLQCKFNGLCRVPDIFNYTMYDALDGKEFDSKKPSILLIDDNVSIVEFLKEDLDCLEKNEVIKLSDFNIITITGPHAAYNFYCLQNQHQGLNIEYAIIDVAYTGSIIQDGLANKYNGVDVYESIKEFNPKVKALFYTNVLNDSIKSNVRMINRYMELTGKNINDDVLFKTTLNIRRRRAEISERLFGKDLGRKTKRTC